MTSSFSRAVLTSRASLRLGREAASLSSWLSKGRGVATATRMPVDAAPQLLITAAGRHRPGATRDLTKIIFENGGSVAGTKKMMLEDRFTMMLSVWLPPDGQTAAELGATLEGPAISTQLQGMRLTAELLAEDEAPRVGRLFADDAKTSEQRRFKLCCPQKPGIVLAVTELLKDHGCSISEIDADTVARAGEIWFELECIVDVPAGVDVDEVAEGLRYWTRSKEDRATVIFDTWLKPHFNVLSGA